MWFFPYSDNNPTRKAPVLTISLIAINVVVFLGTWHGGEFMEVVGKYAFVPAEPKLLTMITSQFLHGGYMHVIFNMWFLWLFGDNLEDLIGKIAFVPFYLLCGISAAVLHAIVAGSGAGAEIPTIGASGAVAGILGAYFVLFYRSSVNGIPMFLIFPIPLKLKVPSIFFLGLYITMEIVYGLNLMGMSGYRVAHWAHIGGFIFGAGVLFLLISTRAVIVPNIEKVRRGEYANISAEEQFLGRVSTAYEKNSFASIPDEYRKLLATAPSVVFAPEKQMRIARAIQAAKDLPLAVDAYRRMMEAYPLHPLAHRASLEIAKIAAFNFNDRRMSVTYLEWVKKAAGEDQLTADAGNLIKKVWPGYQPGS